jgi:hypothetical protein
MVELTDEARSFLLVGRFAGRALDDANTDDRRDPDETAQELARLAEGADHPATRAWYLQWARAFQRLAQMRDRDRTPGHREDH